MTIRSPITQLPTHEVTNVPPPLERQDLFGIDRPLQEGLRREDAAWAEATVSDFAAKVGTEEVLEWANQANRYPPELKAFDRNGRRINQVTFHPAYHNLMALAIGNDVPTFAWNNPRPGNHVAHGALSYLLNQIEGVYCPEPEGAFYAYPSFEGLLGRSINGRTASTTTELAEIILDEAKVAVVPGEAFGAPGYFRFSFALGDDDLAEGIGRIADLIGRK